MDINAHPPEPLFDPYGRLVPGPESLVYNKISRRYFRLAQPEIDYSNIHASLSRHLPAGSGLSLLAFEAAARKILRKLEGRKEAENLLKGVRVPFYCLPQGAPDYGQELEVFLEGVAAAFREKYPQCTFTNYFQGKLAGNVGIVEGSRHDRLIERRKDGPVVGWYFPNCLSEYSLSSQRRLVSGLPDELMLSGGVDAAAAFIGSPGLLVKKDNIYPPLLCLSALESMDENYFYHFEAYGWNLTFNRRSSLGAVAEYWAGGITVIE